MTVPRRPPEEEGGETEEKSPGKTHQEKETMDRGTGQPPREIPAKDSMALQEEEDDHEEDRIERTASPRKPAAGQMAKLDRPPPADLLEVESSPPRGEGKVEWQDPAMRDSFPSFPPRIGDLSAPGRRRGSHIPRRLDPLDFL